MEYSNLTTNEFEIMNILWEAGRPMSRSDIIQAASKRSWKASSIHILLNQLLDKELIRIGDFVQTGKNFGRTYFPGISPEEYFILFVKHNIYYKISPKNTVKAVARMIIFEDDITKEMLADFQKILDKKEAELKKQNN